MLIGQFWGTSAAEGCPAPFCRCDTCNYARIHGGKNIRLRSCFRLSDEIMLDLGADAVVQSMRCLLYTSPSPRDRQKTRMPSSS